MKTQFLLFFCLVPFLVFGQQRVQQQDTQMKAQMQQMADQNKECENKIKDLKNDIKTLKQQLLEKDKVIRDLKEQMAQLQRNQNR